ncbi:MAG: hypothetical protein DWQ37_05390 [Planctomycetota bacterium]|nr:MAG: hypothetical protein DWQ37_05390 [Planctomycetota bacterium]
MPRISRLYPRVPIKTGHNKYIIYGREYGYDPSSLADQQRAMNEAEGYGENAIKAMEQRVGRPASLRETLTLKADAPPPEPYSGSLRRESPVVNPFRQRMETIAGWSEVHEYQRVQKQKRLEALTKAADEWDRQHEAAQANAALQSSPDYIRAMRIADERLDGLRLDPSVQQSTVEAAEQARDQLQKGKLSPGAFFQSIKEPLPSPGEVNATQ